MNLKHSILAAVMMATARLAPRKDIIVPDTGPHPPLGADDAPLPLANLVPEQEPEPKAAREPVVIVPQPRRFGRNIVRALARQGRSAHLPHQSTRETARRLGGNEWEAYKAADRARRGLGG